MNRDKRGKMIYVPIDVLRETEEIMTEQNITKRANAFDKMVKYSQVGREAEKIYKMDFRDTFAGLFKRKKGSARDVIFISVILFMFSIGFFVVYNISYTVTDSMIGISAINQSAAAVQALRGSQAVADRMDYVVFGLFIGLVLALIISGWFIGGNPIFMVIYFLVVVMGVVFSTVLSNTWETTTQSSIFGTTITHFPLTNNLMSNLPVYIAVIGFLGIVVMFAKPYVTGGAEY